MVNCAKKINVHPVLFVNNWGSLVIIVSIVNSFLDFSPSLDREPCHKLHKLHATDRKFKSGSQPRRLNEDVSKYNLAENEEVVK